MKGSRPGYFTAKNTSFLSVSNHKTSEKRGKHLVAVLPAGAIISQSTDTEIYSFTFFRMFSVHGHDLKMADFPGGMQTSRHT